MREFKTRNDYAIENAMVRLLLLIKLTKVIFEENKARMRRVPRNERQNRTTLKDRFVETRGPNDGAKTRMIKPSQIGQTW